MLWITTANNFGYMDMQKLAMFVADMQQLAIFVAMDMQN